LVSPFRVRPSQPGQTAPLRRGFRSHDLVSPEPRVPTVPNYCGHIHPEAWANGSMLILNTKFDDLVAKLAVYSLRLVTCQVK
jgi:hypothetical protein